MTADDDLAASALRGLRLSSWRTRRELICGDESVIPAGELVEIVSVVQVLTGVVQRVSVRWVGSDERPMYAHAVHLSHLEEVQDR